MVVHSAAVDIFIFLFYSAFFSHIRQKQRIIAVTTLPNIRQTCVFSVFYDNMYSSIRYESPHTRNGVAVLYTTHTNCRLISTATATIENHYYHRNMFLLLLKALAIPNQAQDLLYSMPCICNICFIYCFFFRNIFQDVR